MQGGVALAAHRVRVYETGELHDSAFRTYTAGYRRERASSHSSCGVLCLWIATYDDIHIDASVARCISVRASDNSVLRSYSCKTD